MTTHLGRLPAVLRSSTVAIRQRRSNPQTLIFFVTSRCNARCDFCLYKDSVENPTRRSDELRVDEVKQIAAAYGPLHYLAISGGEPFVRRDLGDICQAFIDSCGTSVIGIPSNFAYGDVMVDTVGPLLERNPGVVVELQLSIDNLGALHDQSRGVVGLFDRAISNFRRLEELRATHRNLSLKANVVWLERNRDAIDEIVGELHRLINVDRVHLTYPHQRMVPAGAGPGVRRDFDAFRSQAERVSNEAGNRFDPFAVPMRAAKVSGHRLLGEAIRGSTPMGSVCEAGRHMVVIDEVGAVYPCEMIWQPIGHLRECGYDISSVLSLPAYHEFRDAHLGPDSCNCTWSCAAMTAVSVSLRRYPRMAGDAARIVMTRPKVR